MKFCLVFVSLLSLASGLENTCFGAPEYTLFPSNESCSKYIKCIDNVAHLLNCPVQHFFNKINGKCDFGQNIKCLNDDSVTTKHTHLLTLEPNVNCSGTDDFSYLRSPIDCSIYYQCIADEAYLLSCPRGLYFSVELSTCTSYDEANCTISSPTTVSLPPTTTIGPSVNCDGIQNFRFVASPLSCSVS